MRALRPANYSPAVFNVADIGSAKRIILTPDDRSTEERWNTEGPYLISLIEKTMSITEESTILDYGCGIGRLSKALIERFGCFVVGVDISPSMRALASAYVNSPRFTVGDPQTLQVFSALAFGGAVAAWVLQHCEDPATDIDRIHSKLKGDARLFVLNDRSRFVPTSSGWVDDGLDIREALLRKFDLCHGGNPDPIACGKSVAASSFWATYSPN